MKIKAPWTDNFPLEIFYGWIAAMCILAGILLLTECSPKQAHAGQWSIEGGMGAALFRNTVDDGTWRQDRVQKPNNRLFDQAWKVGVAYRINATYSIQGHYLSFGENATKSRFGSDEAYYGGKCPGPDCPTAHYKVVDKMWGYDLTVSRYWPINEKAEWYLTGGGAVVFHELKWTKPDSTEFGPMRFNGAIPMLVLGGGLCWGPLCWDNLFYTGTLSMNGGCLNGGQYECGYPLAKQVGTSMLVVKIPFGS